MPYHVLVVEDDSALLELYSLYLERGQFSCTAVSSAQEALDVLKTLAVDILMTDVNLGEEVDGLELIRTVRRNEQYDHIKIATLTSFPERYDTANPLINLSLNKPVNYQKLMSALHQLLENDLT